MSSSNRRVSKSSGDAVGPKKWKTAEEDDKLRYVVVRKKMAAAKKINPLPFYAEWAGHPVADLATVHTALYTERPKTPIIYLAGDSSLDNKAWIPSSGPGGEPLSVPVPDIYSSFLDPAKPKADVAFWLNHYLGSKASVINAAVEASLLRQRETALLPHDEFIRDHIRSDDILIVSIGANDIALDPNTATMRHMFQLAWLSSRKSIEEGTASSLRYFRHMFKDQISKYISQLVSKQKPRAIIVCMIYFPLEASASSQTSWADSQLKMLGYGRYPDQLQAAIRQIYESATALVKIEGSTVVPCAVYEALDGKNEGDYVARVEPSVEGGRKLAALLREKIRPLLSSTNPTAR